MSFEEKSNENRLRFSRVITLGDLLLALGMGIPIIVGAVKLYDRVDDDEKRIATIESVQSGQSDGIYNNTRDLAVLKDRYDRNIGTHN